MFDHRINSLVLLVSLLCGRVEGHGRMISPPGRPTAWRYDHGTPIDYTDNGKNCGGQAYQHENQGGKCGVCGDPYDMEQPRENENTGKYGTGTIVANFVQGQVVKVIIQLTAPHKGYFEFNLCVLEDSTKPESNECMDKHLLLNTDGGTRTPAGDLAQDITIGVKLPAYVTCEHCVFRWRYRAGNSWGTDELGSGIGYGPQEEFYSCADVKIRPLDDSLTSKIPPPDLTHPSTAPSTTTVKNDGDKSTSPGGPTGAPPPIVNASVASNTMTTSNAPFLTPDPAKLYGCYFGFHTGDPKLDADLDALCACACDVKHGLCDLPDVCVCF